MKKPIITEDSYIFKYTELTDFEQRLFLEHQVKELQKIIKNKNIEIGILKNEIEILEDIGIDINTIKRQYETIKNQRETLAGLNVCISRLKEQIKK